MKQELGDLQDKLERFSGLVEAIVDWDLFLMFIIIDGNTKGKEHSKLVWFINEFKKYINTTIDESWVS
jgi:hypothetical protein